jgi:uncharacterized protein
MNTTRNYETPFGINVYGSAIIQTAPDFVVIRCSVSCVAPKPNDAFRTEKESVNILRHYLSSAKISAVSSSRTSLYQEFAFAAGIRKPIGYKARTDFRITLQDLDAVEEVLSGIIEAGVNEVASTDFQTSKLKELRAEARRQAFEAAREKAEVYSKAAGIKVGEVIHIEDLNPDLPANRDSHALSRGSSDGDDADSKTFEPGKIIIQAAVMVAFTIDK